MKTNKGLSLHIGLNYVNPNFYSGWNGELNACEYDANDMESIALRQGFKTHKLIRSEATRENVINEIKRVASILQSGDFFLLSYSGHGGQVPDFNSDERDAEDETWCLFDGQLIDDELKMLWTEFAEDVRVLVISDSCHSGTIIKDGNDLAVEYSDKPKKFMPSTIAYRAYNDNRQLYEQITAAMPSKEDASKKINASIKLISGCQDNQFSYDGTFNGKFTAVLKRVWHEGKFKGNYYDFHKDIQGHLPAYQSPNYKNSGKSNKDFDYQKPFTINKEEEEKK